ncbi:branched-chain amino acid ABC transporter substrate-binding protein [Pseudonocardiaceae bacterium YIM PH 21723]|nr:branched-chain amino acid ABC transporter substrate-binding protein [Pseudonocardiaceae bacterium YIM PH 21723]
MTGRRIVATFRPSEKRLWLRPAARRGEHVQKQLVTVAVAALTLSVTVACGTNKTEDGGSGGSCDTSKGTLVLGVIAPQTGGLSAMGLGIKNSAQLAVDQANSACTVKGYKLQLQTEDDEAKPQIGQQAATKLASDTSVVGVVGTLNSSVAETVQPVLAEKKIAMISPANTNPSLSRGKEYPTAPKRAAENYFRVCATDDLQGPFGAKYLVEKAGKKNIAIITDGKTYGDGLAGEFEKLATSLGAKIAGKEKVGEKDTDFSGVIAKIRGANPDAVFYGGEFPVAGPLSKQLKDAGLNIPLMGGDGIYDPKFIDLGGKDGDFATSVGAPPDELPSAKKFVDDYSAKKFKDAFSAYGAFAYDAANALIGGLKKVTDAGDWSADKRADLLKAIGEYKGQGATGEVAFDQYGDSTNKLLTVYQVKSGKWGSVQSGTYNK